MSSLDDVALAQCVRFVRLGDVNLFAMVLRCIVVYPGKVFVSDGSCYLFDLC